MPAKRRCLVLAAGFGTRMGPIGKRLPKVIWPVFEMSLLELQVRFARKLGCDEIYVNLHHQSDDILAHAKTRKTFSDVHWLLEKPEILDIGGGIHNLASQPHISYQGELLILNSDQFLWFTSQEIETWKAAAGDWDALLLTLSVNSSQGYNQLNLVDRRFTGVVPNAQLPRDVEIETYSGNALIRLDRLDRSSGPSAFFSSVASATKKVMTAPLRKGRYWDFGTAGRYYASMQGIMNAVALERPDEFVSFLLAEGGFETLKLDKTKHAYGCSVPGLINLGNDVPSLRHPPGVILSGPSRVEGTQPILVYDSEVQYLD